MQLQSILDRISFSPKELSLVELFKRKPEHILAVSDLLVEKGLLHESCDLLSSYLERYPNRIAARVAYSKILFKQGLILDAHEVLTQFSPLPFEGNSFVNYLGLQTSLLLDKENTVLRIFQFLDDNHEHTPLTRKLYYQFQNYGFLETKKNLIQHLSADFPKAIIDKFILGFSVPQDQKSYQNDLAIDGFEHFQRTSLKDIFLQKTGVYSESSCEKKGVDLFAIAKTYASQGLFMKSLEIYRNLYIQNPGSEYLKTQITIMAEKITEQKKNDIALDSHLALKMDCVQYLDKKISVLWKFLKKIEKL